MTGIPFEALEDADLVVGATYQGGRAGNAGDDPISKLFRVGKHGIGNQGGFRRSGSWEHPNLVVLYTSKEDPDWPDSIDHTTGRLTYYGDNKTPGKDLLDTPRQGNRLLKAVFSELHAGSRVVPPFFVFEKAGSGRDVVFRGLAAPGGQGLRPGEDLAIDRRWEPGSRFENYLATFTILHAPSIGRRWLGELYAGEDLAEHCPRAWRRWRQEGNYEPLGLEGKSVTRVQTRSSSGFELSEEQDREARRLPVDSPEAQEIDSYLRFLKERSFGGKKQAVAPGMERLAIELEAPAMPGADEAADWISSRFDPLMPRSSCNSGSPALTVPPSVTKIWLMMPPSRCWIVLIWPCGTTSPLATATSSNSAKLAQTRRTAIETATRKALRRQPLARALVSSPSSRFMRISLRWR